MIELLGNIDWAQFFAIAGTAGTAFMAYLNRRAEEKKKDAVVELARQKEMLEAEKKTNEFLKENIYVTKLRTLKQIFDLRSFNALEIAESAILQSTCFDRLTVMFMMNGKVDFNFMTVIYDMSQKRGAVESPYRKVPINDEYRALISSIISRPVWMTGDHAYNRLGEIGEFIKMEGVTYIGWFRVKRIALDDFNDLLVYLSWSTEESEPPSSQDKRHAELLTNSRIIPLLVKILSVPDDSDATELLDEIQTSGAPK